jgi:anti-anti-sigma factor
MEGKFNIVKNAGTLEITLAGGLDAGNAPAVSDKLQEYKGQEITRMVFFAKDLNYIASAGIRVIVFAVQKILKPGSDAYFIGGQPDVLSVIKMTGIDDALILQENYEG